MANDDTFTYVQFTPLLAKNKNTNYLYAVRISI